MGFHVDATDFQKGLTDLMEKGVPDDIDRGLYVSGNALLRDAIYEKPFAPFDEGTLRGSARTQTPDGVMRPMTQGDSANAKTIDGEHANSIIVGFNIIYAARLHEISPENMSNTDKLGRVLSGHWPLHWKLPGSGPKFLESKMAAHPTRYLEIMGEYLRRRLGG
jgi:hypothetical protein